MTARAKYCCAPENSVGFASKMHPGSAPLIRCAHDDDVSSDPDAPASRAWLATSCALRAGATECTHSLGTIDVQYTVALDALACIRERRASLVVKLLAAAASLRQGIAMLLNARTPKVPPVAICACHRKLPRTTLIASARTASACTPVSIPWRAKCGSVAHFAVSQSIDHEVTARERSQTGTNVCNQAVRIDSRT